MHRPVFKTPDKDHVLSAPPFIQLELSSGCNQRCIQCYNFWREETAVFENMSRKNLDILLDEFIRYKVMHVVLSGGEPLLNFNNLEHAVKRLTRSLISVSVNSNLTLATPERMKRLYEAGLPHILTSLNAKDEASNARITSTEGSFQAAVNGIKAALAAGIRVSVNMVVSAHNIDMIYETARVASELGCQKFNVTRTIPVLPKGASRRAEFEIGPRESRRLLDECLRIDEAFDFEAVGTMVPYPYCCLGDLEKYGLLLEKCACVAGTKLMSINVNGDVHACVHESKVYGNVFSEGLRGAWKKLGDWHAGRYFPDDCKRCMFFDQCVAGCRMAAKAYNTIGGDDNLKQGVNRITKKIPVQPTPEMYALVESGQFIVPQGLRFRKEDGFYYVTTFGAKGVIVENQAAQFLNAMQREETAFTLAVIGQNKKSLLAYCLFHGLIELEQGGNTTRITEFRNS